MVAPALAQRGLVDAGPKLDPVRVTTPPDVGTLATLTTLTDGNEYCRVVDFVGEVCPLTLTLNWRDAPIPTTD